MIDKATYEKQESLMRRLKAIHVAGAINWNTYNMIRSDIHKGEFERAEKSIGRKENKIASEKKKQFV